MIKITIKSLCLGAFVVALFLLPARTDASGAPDWEVRTQDFEHQMQVYTQVNDPEGNPVDSEGSMLAVFKDGVVRGVSDVIFVPDVIDNGSQALFMPQVWSNETSETGLYFKVYDSDADRVYEIDHSFVFEADATFGAHENAQHLAAIDTGEIITVQDLIDEALEAGDDTVRIVDGHELSVPIVIEGEKGDGLTLVATGGRDATVIDMSGADHAVIIRSDDVTIEGFTFGNFTSSGILIEGDNARIVDNTIDCAADKDGEDPADYGILIEEGTAGSRIGGNNIEDAALAGVKILPDSYDTVITNNRIARHAVGIDNEGEETTARFNTIKENTEYGARSVPEWELDARRNRWVDNGENTDGNVDDDNALAEEESTGVGTGALARGGEKAEDKGRGLGVQTTGDGNNGEVFVTALPDDAEPSGVSFTHGDNAAYSRLTIDDEGKKAGEITEVTLDVGYTGTDPVAYWFNDEEWEKCSEQTAFADPDRFKGFKGYIEIVIGWDSSPSLADFSSRDFAVGTTNDADDADDNNNDDDDNCFIATAAYGTPLAAEIDVLRRFRDQKLLSCEAGRSAVDAYYRFSPPLADLIRQSDVVQAIVRKQLEPVVTFSRSLLDETQ